MRLEDTAAPAESYDMDEDMNDCLQVLCSFGFKPVSNDDNYLRLASKKKDFILLKNEKRCRFSSREDV